MRTLILCLFCGALAAQNVPVKTGALCSAEGKVVNAAGEPLADAKLKLQPVASAGPAGFQGTRVSFVTLTDESGNFAFAGIEPGAYTFSAELSGYLKALHGARRSSPSGAPLSLAAGERRTGIEFRLQRQGVIAGRVLRPGGIAVGALQVAAARLVYANGKKQLRSFATSIANNDEGRFRLSGLEPGRYYIIVSWFPPIGGGATQYLSGSAPDPVQTTFYPSSPDASGARVIDVAAGAMVSGVEIVAIQSPEFALRGRVVNRSGQDLRSLAVSPWPTSGMTGAPSMMMLPPPPMMPALRSGTQSDLGTVPRGRTALAVRGTNPEGRLIVTRHVIDVEGPLENLELPINPPFPVQGRLSVEDGAIPPGLKVSAATQDAQMEAILGRSADAGPEGGFTLPDVNAGRYTVSVTGMPEGYYVKSIRLGKVNVLEDDLDISQEPEQPLEVELSAKAATIGGSVTGAGAGVTVAMVPQGEKLRARPEFYRTTLTDRSGRFTLANLPPGEYNVFAWEDVESGAWMDPDFLKPVEGQGVPITLGEDAVADLELKAIP